MEDQLVAFDEGPKVTPYSRLPKRLDHGHMEAMWQEAAKCHGNYSAHLWVTVLAMLYGSGLRRGELERLNLEHFDRAEETLRIMAQDRSRIVCRCRRWCSCLQAYLPLRHNQLEAVGSCGEPALLVSRIGQRLSGMSISHGIHAIA